MRWFLCSAIREMRGGAPGVMRKRFEASDRSYASNRLEGTHRSVGYQTKCCFPVGRLQLSKCFRAVFKLGHRFFGWRSINACLLPVERLDWGGLITNCWQSAHFSGDHDRVSHRVCAQLRSVHNFRPARR